MMGQWKNYLYIAPFKSIAIRECKALIETINFYWGLFPFLRTLLRIICMFFCVVSLSGHFLLVITLSPSSLLLVGTVV